MVWLACRLGVTIRIICFRLSSIVFVSIFYLLSLLLCTIGLLNVTSILRVKLLITTNITAKLWCCPHTLLLNEFLQTKWKRLAILIHDAFIETYRVQKDKALVDHLQG